MCPKAGRTKGLELKGNCLARNREGGREAARSGADRMSGPEFLVSFQELQGSTTLHSRRTAARGGGAP